jgi:hypothetical protein
MLIELKVDDIKCVDNSSRERGVTFLCSQKAAPAKIVSLIFDERISHEQTGDLVKLLSEMGLKQVEVQLLADGWA